MNGKNHEVLYNEEDEEGKPQTAHLESDNKESFASDRRAVSQPASNPGTFPPSLYHIIISTVKICFSVSPRRIEAPVLMISAFPSKFQILSK